MMEYGVISLLASMNLASGLMPYITDSICPAANWSPKSQVSVMMGVFIISPFLRKNPPGGGFCACF